MQLSCEDYTIGWIAALPHELAPAQALLDEKHESFESLPGDNNTYTLGRMGKHNVVIVALPMGVIGTNAAAKAAKDLIRTFPNVRFGLMVGIGGGVPTGPEDVRLGDIVVSTQQGRSGGVVQYDFGTELQYDTDKTLQQDNFVIKSFLREPHTSLQTAVANLKSRSLVDGYEYHEIYEKMLEKKPRMKQYFKKPTVDVLYRPEYVHRAGTGDDCSTCDVSQIIERSHRIESVVHYGLIGSGNQVIRNAVIRDELYGKEKILCFEMEAAGLMKDFECMVIRGICDYCDSHKNKDWQPYAAAIAAAYAKELLLVLPVQQVIAMPKSIILETINQDLRNISEQTTKIAAVQQSLEFRKALEWIDAPNPETNFLDAQKRKDPETGTWLADSPIYVKWKTGPGRHLWLHGKPGCGKSVLTATAIPDIRRYCKLQDAAFAMFYFTFTDTGKQSWRDCLRSLVAQLVLQEPAVTMLIQAHNTSKGSAPNEEFLKNLLLTAIQPYRQIFIAIDALDESPPNVSGDETIRSIVLDNLASLSASRSNIKFFLTSRDLPDIRDSMELLEVYSVPMVAECIDRDITKYVANQLIKDKKLSRLNDKMKNNIKNTLTIKANGMFRWAHCQLHQLKTLPLKRPKDIEQALNTLPKSLDETYERMLESIDHISQAEVHALLKWLAYAQRPLSLLEIAETVTIELNQGDSIVDTPNRPQPEEILNLLAGFVIIKHEKEQKHNYLDEDSGYSDDTKIDEERTIAHSDVAKPVLEDFEHVFVQLAHFSIKEYLESPRSSLSPFHLVPDRDQQFLSNCCLVYLMHYAESEKRLGSEEDLETFPLLRYTAKSWPKHHVDTKAVQYTMSFLLSRTAVVSWFTVFDVEEPWRDEPFAGCRTESPNNIPQALYFASYLGLYVVVEELIKLGVDVIACRGRSRSALAAACEKGHEKVVELLLKSGAYINDDGNNADYQQNPLYLASVGGNLGLIRILTEAGADCSMQSKSYRNSLQVAAKQGKGKNVKHLIAVAKDLDARRGDLNAALGYAAKSGHPHLVKMLIEDYGADPKARSGGFANALYAAASEYIDDDDRTIKVITLLLNAGADINAQGGYYGNALQAAVAAASPFGDSYGEIKVIKLLLNAGADINAQGGYYGNALQAAAAARHYGDTCGKIKIIKLLLGSGAKINAQGGYYGSALQAAVACYLRNRKIEVVKLLFDAGAKINTQDRHGTFPLMHAAAAGCIDLVKMLVERGADVSVVDREGRNAIHYAARAGNIEAYKQLITMGICDLNCQDTLGKTILDYVCLSGSCQMLTAYLETEPHESPADIPRLAWSPWHWACRAGSFEMLEILDNADLHAWIVETDQPAAKWAPLDIAVYYGNDDLVRIEDGTLEGHNWHSLCQSGSGLLHPSSSPSKMHPLRYNSFKPAKKHFMAYCRGCNSYVRGALFKCLACEDVSYCLMCRHDSEASHPGHEWNGLDSVVEE